MFRMNAVDEELSRGLGLTMRQIEPFLKAGGDEAEMKLGLLSFPSVGTERNIAPSNSNGS
jgi:hypothetical protein